MMRGKRVKKKIRAVKIENFKFRRQRKKATCFQLVYEPLTKLRT